MLCPPAEEPQVRPDAALAPDSLVSQYTLKPLVLPVRGTAVRVEGAAEDTAPASADDDDGAEREEEDEGRLEPTGPCLLPKLSLSPSPPACCR